MVEYGDTFNFKLVVFICLILLLILISFIIHYTLPQYESFVAPFDLVEYGPEQEPLEEPDQEQEEDHDQEQEETIPCPIPDIKRPKQDHPVPSPIHETSSAFLTFIFKTNMPLTCGEVQQNIEMMYSKLNAKLAIEFKLNLQREHLIINELNGTLVVFIEVNSVDGEDLLIRLNGNPNMVFDLDITDEMGNVIKSVVFAKDTLSPGFLSYKRPEAMVSRTTINTTTTITLPETEPNPIEITETPSKNIFQAMSNAIMDGITPSEPSVVPEATVAVVPEATIAVVPEALSRPEEVVAFPEEVSVPEDLVTEIIPSNMSELHLNSQVDDTYMNFYPQRELTPEETNKLVENMNQNMSTQYNIKPANFMD